MTKAVVALDASEIALLAAASRIFAAYIQAGRITEGSENDMIERAVAEALRMAGRIEEMVDSVNESE